MDEGPDTEDLDHSFEVVGQNVEAHLRSDLFEGFGQEVGAPHPRLERSEGVFDGLTADAHGIGHVVEPGLHRVEHAFVLPALESFELVRRAFRFERTGEAGLSGQVKQAVR